MDHFLDKLSSYNLFNYLLPGVLFAVLVGKVTPYHFLQSDILIGVFVYYFIGLVISRAGSLFIEPFLKKLKFLKFAPYSEFVIASKKDEKIELFSESNNMYRTLCAMCGLLFVLRFYRLIEVRYFLQGYGIYVLSVALLLMFLFAYRKQTNYITKRIKANL